MVQDSEKKLMKIKNTPENRDKCHCKVCPSYPYKCGGEVLYCSKGPSDCDICTQKYVYVTPAQFTMNMSWKVIITVIRIL